MLGQLKRTPWAAALRYPAYRWFLLGRLAGSATIQMRSVAQGWLVYNLTGSALTLTWVGAARSAVTLVFSLYGGALSDRLPKRWVMFWCRLAIMSNNIILATLVLTGRALVWHIAVSGMVDGLIFAFMVPAQGAIPAELVKPKDLLNALSIISLGQGLMSILSSAGAGLMIDRFGAAGVFYTMAGLFGFVALTLTQLPDSQKTLTRDDAPPLRQIREGLVYLSAQPILIGVLSLRLARTVLYMPYRTLLPAFVEENLQLGATGLGLMLSMSSVGALLSSMTLTVYGNRLRQGRWLFLSGLGAGVGLIFLVVWRTMPMPYLWMLIIGVMGNVSMVISNAMLQTRCDPAYRGRISGVRMMLQGLQPLGSLPAGALADTVGSDWVIGGQGALLILAFGVIARLKPDLRRVK